MLRERRVTPIRKMPEDPHRRVAGTHVIGSAPHVMVGTGDVEEARDPVDFARRGRATSEHVPKRRPAGETMLERECVLHIAEGGDSGCIG